MGLTVRVERGHQPRHLITKVLEKKNSPYTNESPCGELQGPAVSLVRVLASPPPPRLSFPPFLFSPFPLPLPSLHYKKIGGDLHDYFPAYPLDLRRYYQASLRVQTRMVAPWRFSTFRWPLVLFLLRRTLEALPASEYRYHLKLSVGDSLVSRGLWAKWSKQAGASVSSWSFLCSQKTGQPLPPSCTKDTKCNKVHIIY